MTTVAEIRAGKTCPGCKSDCRNFAKDADCCIYNTFFSKLYSEAIKDESDKEVHYEPVNKKTICVEMKYHTDLESKGPSIKSYHS